MYQLLFSLGINIRNFKRVAYTYLKLCYASKSVTDERPKSNILLQLFRSLRHNEHTMLNNVTTAFL